MMHGRNQKLESLTAGESFKPIAVSTAFGVVTCVLILLLMSVAVTTQNVPSSAIEPMAIFAMSAGAFVAGFLCAKAMRSGGLMYGGACGIVLTVIVLIAGISFGNGLGIPALFRIVFICLSSMLGGVVGVNTRRRRK